MTVTATVLFESPQTEIASLIRTHLQRSIRTRIVAGFLTVEGIALLKAPLEASPSSLDTLIVGAGTYRGFDALDQLLGIGVDPAALHVHLGHSRLTGNRAKHRFYRYHPMLHSKVYYMEHADGTASAFIGSHNITGFALGGLNGEASVLLEGPANSDEFNKVRRHIAEAKAQSTQYSPSKKEALAWWTREALHGIRDKANDLPRDATTANTIVILAENKACDVPAKKDIIYFELPLALGQVQSLRSEVHLYVFDSLPSSPIVGLQSLHKAIGSCWCKTMGLEMAKGGVELLADWEITGKRAPSLVKTVKPFRPTPISDMQQVRVEAYGNVRGRFEYLFDKPSKKWTPELWEDNQTPSLFGDEDQKGSFPTQVSYDADFRETLEAMALSPNPEHHPWQLVRDLVAEDASEKTGYSQALEEYSPDSGSYIMLSLRRREQ